MCAHLVHMPWPYTSSPGRGQQSCFKRHLHATGVLESTYAPCTVPPSSATRARKRASAIFFTGTRAWVRPHCTHIPCPWRTELGCGAHSCFIGHTQSTGVMQLTYEPFTMPPSSLIRARNAASAAAFLGSCAFRHTSHMPEWRRRLPQHGEHGCPRGHTQSTGVFASTYSPSTFPFSSATRAMKAAFARAESAFRFNRRRFSPVCGWSTLPALPSPSCVDSVASAVASSRGRLFPMCVEGYTGAPASPAPSRRARPQQHSCGACGGRPLAGAGAPV